MELSFGDIELRGLFFKNLDCYDYSTTQDESSYLLGNHFAPPLRPTNASYAAITQVIEGLIERCIIPCLSGTASSQIQIDSLIDLDLDGIVCPSLIKLDSAFSSSEERNNNSTANRSTMLNRWYALIEDTNKLISSLVPYVKNNNLTVYPPSQDLKYNGGYVDNGWSSSIDLSNGEATCARDILGLDDVVANTIKDILILLGMNESFITLPSGSLKLFKTNGTIQTVGGVWDTQKFINNLNLQNKNEIPTSQRAVLDLLWSSQTVLGNCLSNWAKMTFTAGTPYEQKRKVKSLSLNVDGTYTETDSENTINQGVKYNSLYVEKSNYFSSNISEPYLYLKVDATSTYYSEWFRKRESGEAYTRTVPMPPLSSFVIDWDKYDTTYSVTLANQLTLPKSSSQFQDLYTSLNENYPSDDAISKGYVNRIKSLVFAKDNISTSGRFRIVDGSVVENLSSKNAIIAAMNNLLQSFMNEDGNATIPEVSFTTSPMSFQFLEEFENGYPSTATLYFYGQYPMSAEFEVNGQTYYITLNTQVVNNEIADKTLYFNNTGGEVFATVTPPSVSLTPYEGKVADVSISDTTMVGIDWNWKSLPATKA